MVAINYAFSFLRKNSAFKVVFPIILSKINNIAGRKHSTIRKENIVPLPRSKPISAAAALEDVANNVNPAMDKVAADTRMDLKVSPKEA